MSPVEKSLRIFFSRWPKAEDQGDKRRGKRKILLVPCPSCPSTVPFLRVLIFREPDFYKIVKYFLLWLAVGIISSIGKFLLKTCWDTWYMWSTSIIEFRAFKATWRLKLATCVGESWSWLHLQNMHFIQMNIFFSWKILDALDAFWGRPSSYITQLYFEVLSNEEILKLFEIY